MFSFRYKLILLITLVVFLTLGGALGVIRYLLEERFHTQTEESLRRGQNLIEQLFDQRQFLIEQQAQSFAQDPEISRLMSHLDTVQPSAFEQLDTRLQLSSGKRQIILLTDKEGEFRAPPPDLRTLAGSLQKNVLYQKVMNGEQLTGLVFLSEIAYLLTGQPILYQGEMVGALFVGSRFDESVLDFFKLLSGMNIILFHQDKIFLTTTMDYPERQLETLLKDLQTDVGPSLRHRVAASPQKGVLDSFNIHYLLNMPNSQLHPAYALLYPKDEQDFFLKFVQLDLLLLGGVVLLISLFLTSFLYKPALRALDLLQQGMEQVERDNYQSSLKLVGRDEFAQAGESFNQMLRSLQEKQEISDAMNRLVARELAREVLEQQVRPEGELRTLSVLCASPHRLNQLLSDLTAWETLTFINNYFTRMNYCITSHKGIVDQFHGENMRAIFGLAEAARQPALNSLQAGRDLLEALVLFNLEIAGPAGRQMEMGIGIHTGPLVTGHLGAEERQTYSVIGEGVELAGRLQRLTRYYGVSLLISETTYRAVQDETSSSSAHLLYREIDIIQFGKQEPLKIYEVLPRHQTDTALENRVLRFHAARDYLLNKQLKQAVGAFERLHEDWPEDCPTQLLLARCRRYLENDETVLTENPRGAFVIPETLW